MKIGDEVFVHGYVDEIRKDVIIIRNNGGYFGTIEGEIVTCDKCIWSVCNYNKVDWDADTPQTDCYDYSKSEMENIKCGNGITTEIPQTDCETCELDGKADVCKICRVSNYEPQTDCVDIYPLVIIKDRYTGTYSNGEYTAWNMFFEDIPREIDEDDVTCHNFWHSYNGIVGLGKTPNEAIDDLHKKLNVERNE